MKEYKGRRSIMTTLREATVGSSYVIKKIHGTGPLKRRIMDMGLSKNTEIYVSATWRSSSDQSKRI